MLNPIRAFADLTIPCQDISFRKVVLFAKSTHLRKILSKPLSVNMLYVNYRNDPRVSRSRAGRSKW